MLRKLPISFLSAAVIGLTGLGVSYAADMGQVNQSKRANDQSSDSAKDMNTQPRTGANESTRPNDESTGSTEHKRAQKNNTQPDQSSTQGNSNTGSTGSDNTSNSQYQQK